MTSPQSPPIRPDARSKHDDIRTEPTGWGGAFAFLLVFVFWLTFSNLCVTFYRDDNVAAFGPLIVEAGRLLMAGHIPWHTMLVGGGGGSPLVSIMQPGVLYPPNLVVAIVWGHDPELMMNVLVSFHLALFGLGGWYLARVLRAPTWAALVAAFALGFSGAYAIGAGNWEGLYLPYAFLPWVIGAIIRVGSADSRRELIASHVILAVAVVGIFYSGGPTAAYYGALAVIVCVIAILAAGTCSWTTLAARLIPQCIVFAVFVVPLLWRAKVVYDYYGRIDEPAQWTQLSVPLQAYLGLFLPSTYSIWEHIGTETFFTNALMACGAVPAWFTLVAVIRSPGLVKRGDFGTLLVGMGLFMLVLSPAAFNLSGFFASMPISAQFRWPFRALPAFHVLTVVLFLMAAREATIPRTKWGALACIVLCCAVSWYSVAREFMLARPGEHVISWFATNRYYEDRETWSKPTLERLRASGYLMNHCRWEPRGVWFEKPRLFFNGNMGAQYQVPTVSRYLLGARSRAYRELGVHFSGAAANWPAARRFIESSPQTPLRGPITWQNGIGPADLAELTAKTHVGAMVVENALTEPLTYFLTAPQWERLESREAATVFVRRYPTKLGSP